VKQEDLEEITEKWKLPQKQETKSDTVVLSDTAKKIQETQTQLKAIPDVREDKVAQLKEQIENGTYEIDEEKIADKMLKDSLFNDLT